MSDWIDFHTHAFPAQLAATAVPALAAKGNVQPHHNGTVSGLLAAMDQAGFQQAVVCSIATRPAQGRPIFDWSQQIRSSRIHPFPSCHPDDPDALTLIGDIAKAGFKGIKMHPYYQDFMVDASRLDPLYRKMEDLGLLLLLHTGYDIGFPRDDRAAPIRINRLMERHSGLRLIASHLGAWQDWQEVEKLLLGKPLYMDIAFALEYLAPQKARDLLLGHPAEFLLFGSDSPWADQRQVKKLLVDLALPRSLETAILGGNAARLLAN